MIYVRAGFTWVGMLLSIAVLGAARDTLLTPSLGELPAHQAGTLMACVVVLAITYWFVRIYAPSEPEALVIGAFWLGLALAFELVFFHFIRGVPWSVLSADYRILEGRLLVVLWLTTLLGPYLIVRVTRR